MSERYIIVAYKDGKAHYWSAGKWTRNRALAYVYETSIEAMTIKAGLNINGFTRVTLARD